jgi:UDP-N-acetylmuramoylalanine-D-glutamate ligase
MINQAEENEEVLNKPEIKTAVSSFEHIQERFEAVRDIYESLFLNDSASFDY